MSQAIKNLDKAISNSKSKPKGIKVGVDLWKELNANGRIKWKRGVLVFKNDPQIDSELDFPMINEDIFVHVAPELDDLSYELPSNS